MMRTNAGDLIAAIDAGTLSPMTHVVTRKLCSHLPRATELEEDVVNALDDGVCRSRMAAIEVALWTEIDSLDVRGQGGLRLLLGLTRPEEVIDGYTAGFMILWAREQGITDQQIIDAFHTGPAG